MELHCVCSAFSQRKSQICGAGLRFRGCQEIELYRHLVVQLVQTNEMYYVILYSSILYTRLNCNTLLIYYVNCNSILYTIYYVLHAIYPILYTLYYTLYYTVLGFYTILSVLYCTVLYSALLHSCGCGSHLRSRKVRQPFMRWAEVRSFLTRWSNQYVELPKGPQTLLRILPLSLSVSLSLSSSVLPSQAHEQKSHCLRA